MKSLAALMMLVRTNIDLMSETDIKGLINCLEQELRDRREDKEAYKDDEI